MKALIATPVLFVLGLLVAPPASGQCPLFRDDDGEDAAMAGGRAIVGAAWNQSPSVQFYEKTDQGWRREQSFALGDFHLAFSFPVAMDGDRAIAGNCESNGQVGQVFLFDRRGNQWVRSELVSATVDIGDFFGASLALGGNVAVVGALHFGKGGGDELPRMQVFEFDGTTWSEVAQIVPFTYVVDVDGDTIVLGDGFSHPGFVHVYTKVAGLWVLTQRLQVPTPPNGPFLGTSVALEGDTLAVGACYTHQPPVAGFVEIFRRQGNSWQSVQHIIPDADTSGVGFGSSVALSGSTLLVGAPAGVFGPPFVYRYDHDGTSFVESGRFGPEPIDLGFGRDLALHREDAVIADNGGVSFYRLGFAHESSFCPTTPNSTGAHGTLSVEGCDSLGGQRFTLVASGLPAGVLGVFFFGANTAQVPFGNGFRCVGEPFFRLPGGTTDAAGHLVHDVDFSSSPASAITAGRTWHFQAYHRDPGAGAQLNLTNALSIGITP